MSSDRPNRTHAAALCSEAGIRKSNEDRCAHLSAPDGSALLLVLADGMGGHACGEVASDMAVGTILNAFEKFGFDQPAQLLHDAILTAHEAIQREGKRDPAKKGMGTTVVTAVLRDGEVLVAHVGDSRAFQFRDGLVRRLTEDHLYVSEALGLTEAEARNHAQGHVLSQALGMPGPVEPSIDQFDARSGDRILLCSDGVHGILTEPEISEMLESGGLEEAVVRIVRRAVDGGSRDNCSVVAALTGGE